MDNQLGVLVGQLNHSQNTITIQLDKKDLVAFKKNVPLNNLQAKLVPALEEVGDYVRFTMIPQVFDKEGPGWQKLAPRTVRDRMREGYGGEHPILQRTKDLYKELTDKSHPKHVETIKVDKRVARIEIGGSSVKFVQNQIGKGDPGQRLPARAMLPGTGNIPITDRDKAHIKDILTKAAMSK